MKFGSLIFAALALADEVVFVIIIIVVLKITGVEMPWWFIALLAGFFVAVSMVAYRAVQKNPSMGFESMVGTRCESITEIGKKGTVKIGYELWQARAPDGMTIEAGQIVEVIGQSGLKLKVQTTEQSGVVVKET